MAVPCLAQRAHVALPLTLLGASSHGGAWKSPWDVPKPGHIAHTSLPSATEELFLLWLG